MGMIYKDKLEDYKLALQTFKEYNERFKGYEYVPDALYQSYLVLMKTDKKYDAETYRLELLSKFPDSKHAVLLSNPNYIEDRQRMFVEQDSLYKATYQ